MLREIVGGDQAAGPRRKLHDLLRGLAVVKICRLRLGDPPQGPGVTGALPHFADRRDPALRRERRRPAAILGASVVAVGVRGAAPVPGEHRGQRVSLLSV